MKTNPDPTQILPCQPEDFKKGMILYKHKHKIAVVHTTVREVVVEYEDQMLAVVTREELCDYMNSQKPEPIFDRICNWFSKLRHE